TYRGTQAAFDRTVAGMKNAWANGVKMAFSTDADYYIPGMTRGEVVINFLLSWKASGIPAKDVLKIMTINGYEVSDLPGRRGPIKAGFPAGMIAVAGDPPAALATLPAV